MSSCGGLTTRIPTPCRFASSFPCCQPTIEGEAVNLTPEDFLTRVIHMYRVQFSSEGLGLKPQEFSHRYEVTAYVSRTLHEWLAGGRVETMTIQIGEFDAKPHLP